jgi:hypothetical protein
VSLDAPYNGAGGARRPHCKCLVALDAAENLAEGAMEPAQFVVKGNIAILILGLLPRMPGGVRVGGMLRKEQHEHAGELY